MADILDFKKAMCGREAKEPTEMTMFSMVLSMDENGMYGVHMEVEDWASDEDVAEAFQAAYFKFLIDTGLIEDE